MKALDIAKDAYTFAKNAGNVEMQQKLIDVQEQIQEMQQQMSELRQKADALESENKRLVDISEIEKKIERYVQTFVTMSDDDAKIKYCSACWDKSKVLIQMMDTRGRQYSCPNESCNNKALTYGY